MSTLVASLPHLRLQYIAHEAVEGQPGGFSLIMECVPPLLKSRSAVCGFWRAQLCCTWPS